LTPPPTTLTHTTPKLISGQPLQLVLGASDANFTSATLWYRQVDQSQRWISTEMQAGNASFTATVPADYTGSSFPIQYYFEVADAAGNPTLFPGFREDFRGQPYFVVRLSQS
jgi:hypothetical protein